MDDDLLNEFDAAVKAYASQTGGRAQLDEMLNDQRDGIMDFGYDADDIDDGMKAAAIIALMRIIYGKDDDPREPASMLMMSLIENYGNNDDMDSSDNGDERDGIKQDDELNADDNRKIRMLKPVRSLKSKYKCLPLEKRMLVNLGGIGTHRRIIIMRTMRTNDDNMFAQVFKKKNRCRHWSLM